MTVDSLSGNTFNQTISVPYNYVQYLAGNASFQAIDINPVNAGTFNSGTLREPDRCLGQPELRLPG